MNRVLNIRFFPLLMFFAAFLIAVPLTARTEMPKNGKKQMKQIRENLKNLKGNDALKGVENMRKDSAYMWNPQVVQYGVDACRIMYNTENEKFYLKSKPDTTALFGALYNIYNYVLLTDSAEMKTEHFRFRRQNVDILSRYMKNLAAAPRYFVAKGDWKQVERFSTLVMESCQSEMAANLSQPLVDEQTMHEMAYLNVTACYKMKCYDNIERYAEYATADDVNREKALEMLVYAENERNDSVNYVRHLEVGHDGFPANMFFFSRLVDFYLHQGDNAKVLATADETLEDVLEKAQEVAAMCIIDKISNYDQPTDAVALYGVRETVSLPDNEIAQIFEARAIAYHNQHDRKACITEAQNMLAWNPDHPRADFYIGVSYYGMAEDVNVPPHINDPLYKEAVSERSRLLALARPHLESYRERNPDAASVWAPLLYETYLRLNLGAEFEEIQQYL